MKIVGRIIKHSVYIQNIRKERDPLYDLQKYIPSEKMIRIKVVGVIKDYLSVILNLILNLILRII